MSPVTSPTAGQPGVTLINATGSNFPSGTISPNQVTVSLSPVSPGTGASGTVAASSITTIAGSTRRVTFQIPTSIAVSVPTAYTVSVSGTTAAGSGFTSSNTSALTINPPANIVSIVPNMGTPGQSLSVTITSSYTNFIQGSTVASFGPGISIAGQPEGVLSPITVINATTATVQLSIDPAATHGGRLVLVATGVQQAQLANGFTVVGTSSPQITSVVPNTAIQGQNSLKISITGANTHFAQGTSVVSFGAGITVGALTVSSPTTATATINVDPAAVVGSRTVTMSTGTEVAALTNGFNVIGAALISALSPAAGQQGQQNLAVTITGQYTHFVQGATVVNFGAGITTLNVAVTDELHATATLDLTANATLGTHNVTATSGAESATLNGGFTVIGVVNQAPTVSAGAAQTITLPNAAMLSGSVSDDGLPLGAILSANWSLLSAPTSAGGQFWLKLAPTGALPSVRNEDSTVFDPVTNRLIIFGGNTNGVALNDVWVLTGANALSANASWTQLQPSGTPPAPRYGHSAFYDAPSNRMIVFGGIGSGQFFNDVWVLTNANGTGGSPSWIQLSPAGSAPSLRRYVGLAYDPANNRMIIFGGQTSGTSWVNETWVLSNANGTGSGAPTWSELAPSGTLPSARSNSFVAYDSGSNRLIVFGGAFSVTNNPFTEAFSDSWVLTNANGLGGAPTWILLTPDGAVSSPAQRFEGEAAYNPANNVLTIAGGIGDCVGVDSCSAFSDVWTLRNANGIGGNPTWAQVVPTGGPPAPVGFAAYDLSNDRLISFGGGGSYTTPVVFYSDTWVLTNATGSDPGGVPGSVSFSNPTFSVPDVAGQTSPVITNAAFSIPGSYTLRLTASDSQLSNTSNVVVTVQPNVGTPVLAAVIPNAGLQGQTNLNVTITGQNTHFAQGTTQASFGPGITVSSVTVNSASRATAVLNIDPAAVLGARNVTVTTSAEVVTLSNGFTVYAAGNQPPVVSAGANQTVIKPELFIAANNSNRVLQFDGASGTFVDEFVPAAYGGLYWPDGVIFGPDNNLYVTFATNASNTGPRGVLRFNGATGAFIDQFVPPGSGGLKVATYQTFGPDGNLYVSDFGDGTVKRYNGSTGAFMGVFASGAANPQGLQFGPDGNLYLADEVNVRRYNGTTGAFIDLFVSSGSGGLNQPQGLLFGPDGNLYLSGFFSGAVVRYNGSTGAFINVFASGNGLVSPQGMAFGPDGNFYVGDINNGQVLRYNGKTGAFLSVFVPPGSQGLTGSPNALAAITFSTVNLQGSMSDDGLPSGAMLTGSWSEISGPGTVTFSNPTLSVPDIAGKVYPVQESLDFSSMGTYVLRFTASDSQLSGDADVTITVNPPNPPLQPASITSVSPNSGLQGQQNLSVVITGANTDFVQGMTQISFGAGITVASVAVTDATHATATLNLAGNAALGAHDVTVTTGTEIATLSGGFTVTVAGQPSIISVSPNTAIQGRQCLTIAITGANTHFVQGTTTASFGAGITVVSVAVTDATHASATLNLAPYATIGSHDVTVTTGTETEAQSGGFTVTQPVGYLYSANGTSNNISAYQIDSSTGMLSAVPSSPFSTGHSPLSISTDPSSRFVYTTNNLDNTVSAYSVNSSTAALTMVPGSPFPAGSGPNSVAVESCGRFVYVGNESSNNVSAYSLSQQTGALTPTSGSPFQTGVFPLFNVATYPGGKFLYVPNSYQNGTGFVNTPGSISGFSIDSSTGNLTAISGFPLGTGVFPDWVAVDPLGRFAYVGTGNNGGPTYPVYGFSINSGTGAWSQLVGSPFIMTADTRAMAIDPLGRFLFSANDNANGGSNNAANLVSAFTINQISGALSQVAGSPYPAGSFPAGIIVDPSGNFVYVADFTGAAISGFRINQSSGALTPLTGSPFPAGQSPISLAVAALSPSVIPIISSVNPAYGAQGQQNLAITITGQSTHFGQGTSQVSLGTDITVNSVTVGSSTNLVASITIPANANLGQHNVTVTTGSEIVTLGGGFTVAGPASITSVNPNTGIQGQQNLLVVITGANTHFVQGTTQVSFGSDITVNSSTVASATSVTANITIPANANLGAHTVTVTTGSEIVSLSNGFNVTPIIMSPLISSISPNAGQQGQGGPVAIVGQNTHFVQGVTQVNLGTGITVSNVQVTCPVCLTAQLSLASTAPTGPRNVIVTTGSEVATLSGGFAVQPGTPILTSLNPASGRQGQTFTATMTGLYTHFTQGTTQVSFGPGVTVSAITVSTLTSLTAQLAIDPAATTGTRTLTVTTGTEVASVPNVFTVQPATPFLYSLSPGGGLQGQQGLPVVITGVATHFTQGTSQASFGSGVTVVSLTVASLTSVTAIVNIDAAAAQGPRTVMVTTGSEVVSFTNGFTIASNSALILSLNPGGSSQGASNLPVQIVGQGTHFVQGTSTVGFGPGITVSSLAVTSPTTATATISIDPAASIGPRTVTVTTGSELASFANGFSVVAGVAGITEINPGGGPQGITNLSLAVTAQFTHFVQGTTTISFSGAGITVVSLTVNSPLTATVVVSVDPAAAQGARNVTMTTGSEVVGAPGGFTVTSGTAVLLSASPNTALQGQQNLSVLLTGQLTHFSQGTTAISFGAGITVASVTVTSPLTATVTINVDPAASIALRAITITTGSEIVMLNNGFSVFPGTPALMSVAPTSAQQGQQNLLVTVTGQYTHFTQGATQLSFGSGITVESVMVNSLASLVATVSVDLTAGTGPRTVTATTGPEIVTLANALTIQPLASGPLSLNPDFAMQSQSVSISITGQGTHFAQGTTHARFGPGISVGSGIVGDFGPVTVTSPTTATAQIAVIGSALPSLRTVTVQTGSEVVTAPNSFAVLGTPLISAITPPAADQGQSGTVTILGSYTHFAPGTTQVNFGAGVTVNSVSVNTSFSLIAAITIASSASPGLRTVTVQTGTEVASAINEFSILGPVVGPPPVVNITSPAAGSEVTAPTTVTGTVTSPNLDSWTLQYQSAGSSTWIPFATGTSSSVSGTFDPTLLLNGVTAIQLIGIDASGQAATATISVVVDRNLKVGLFTVSFNDLTVPSEGLPIQIVRTYDSRDQQVGDFGVGWRLSLNAVTITTNGPLGDGWAGTSTGGAFPTYCVQATQNHVLTVVLQDGTTYQFQPVFTQPCQALVPPSQITFGFGPVGNTPPNAALALAGNNQPLIEGGFPGPVTLLDIDNLTTFDPDQYMLTLPDGRVLQVSVQFGLQSMTDLNGNKVTITSAGITHSDGKSVTFERDALNRITLITDPVGNRLQYSYSAAGDLVSFADPLNEVSSYTYNSTHGLLTIQDPSGVQPIRNDYDASGRLVSHTDAYGNVINYTNVTSAQQEIVTDRLGNVTVDQYDADGNIVQVTDALGGVTKRTYDVHDNLQSETNALGNIRTYTYDAMNNRLTETDPLGHTTTYTYNSRNQVLTVTDPLSHATTNTYDSNGNLISTKDPNGNTTNYAYNAAGLRTSMTDALGNVTTYQYDSSGNLNQQTDALGHITTYTYDANGNRLSQTQTRTGSSGLETLLTTYQYDGLNRIVMTTYPDGSTTQIAYNNIGKQSMTTDQLGRQTNYQYDLMGRLTQTTYPDGTNEQSSYDAEGDRITSVDRAGRPTTYAYDPLKRLSKTTYPDTASTATVYDAIGEVKSVSDPLSNTTQYTYDADGRRTQVTDALSHITSFGYDAAGDQTSMTDANSNTTQYQYDADNRRIKVIYPDSTADTTTYDALGRTIAKTDQAGLTTQFQYDKLGHLAQVTDAAGHNTAYSYDEVGERLSQTDANAHTTTFAYDKLGRRVKRTLPPGQAESSTYDAAGNLKTKTDFNVKTTIYNYDVDNRLTSEVPDPSFNAPTVSFTYTATSQRQSMTDASGTTTYFYNLRDRLLSKVTPEGTLTYTYDLAGNLLSTKSSNTGGASVNYAYDKLDRLMTATDNRLASGTTSYSFDAVGNLLSFTYPNSVTHAYTYNSLNRLTNLSLAKGAGTIGSYGYTLGQAGNRTGVTELGGRSVVYTYDNLYRLMGETISGATAGNGTLGYTYDFVGNRLNRTSTVAAVPAASYSYDPDDRLASDTYDANGNTTASNGSTYAYDFENHLTNGNSGATVVVYDGDGNRISKTSGGVTTKYLVDDRNLTGYAQVLEELSGGTVQRVYTYGLNRISQSQASGTSFYGYDGHGSVRLLTDAAGAVTDRYDYDAFGNIVSQAGSTPNVYLYSGEQNDSSLNLYYLRARYLSQATGRFWTMDADEGDPESPISLHKYTYVGNEPVVRLDPSGNQFDIASISVELADFDVLSSITTVHGPFLDKLTGQQLTFNTISAPRSCAPLPKGWGCWVIQWKLLENSRSGGWIVQAIKTSYKSRFGASPFPYWEAWRIPEGSNITNYALTGDIEDDTFKWPGGTRVNAEARFYEGLQLPPFFQPGNVKSAGILPSTYVNPSLPTVNATDPVDRTWTAP